MSLISPVSAQNSIFESKLVTVFFISITMTVFEFIICKGIIQKAIFGFIPPEIDEIAERSKNF